MNKKPIPNARPININPFSVKLSISAFSSIAHRLSGLFLFFMIPFLLGALQTLVETPKGYEKVAELLSPWGYKLAMGLFLAAMLYHLFAGIRHILMDMHLLSESLVAAKISAWVVWGATLLSVVYLGVRLFGGAA
jgi:succinate dehydrogenase / fumarate reductase cytochrome b subunit